MSHVRLFRASRSLPTSGSDGKTPSSTSSDAALPDVLGCMPNSTLLQHDKSNARMRLPMSQEKLA